MGIAIGQDDKLTMDNWKPIMIDERMRMNMIDMDTPKAISCLKIGECKWYHYM